MLHSLLPVHLLQLMMILHLLVPLLLLFTSPPVWLLLLSPLLLHLEDLLGQLPPSFHPTRHLRFPLHLFYLFQSILLLIPLLTADP